MEVPWRPAASRSVARPLQSRRRSTSRGGEQPRWLQYARMCRCGCRVGRRYLTIPSRGRPLPSEPQVQPRPLPTDACDTSGEGVRTALRAGGVRLVQSLPGRHGAPSPVPPPVRLASRGRGQRGRSGDHYGRRCRRTSHEVRHRGLDRCTGHPRGSGHPGAATAFESRCSRRAASVRRGSSHLVSRSSWWSSPARTETSPRR